MSRAEIESYRCYPLTAATLHSTDQVELFLRFTTKEAVKATFQTLIAAILEPLTYNEKSMSQ